jgi:ankyrin repeat protein
MTQLDPYRRAPLHYASADDDVERVTALLAEGADVNAADIEGFTPLHFACGADAVNAVRVLLDSGASLESVNRFGNTPLWVAVANSRGVGDVILLLRERGADPYVVNKHGQTPLGLARLIANYDVSQFFADLRG